MYLPRVEEGSLVKRDPQRSYNHQLKQEAQEQWDNPGQQHSNYQSLHYLVGNGHPITIEIQSRQSLVYRQAVSSLA